MCFGIADAAVALTAEGQKEKERNGKRCIFMKSESAGGRRVSEGRKGMENEIFLVIWLSLVTLSTVAVIAVADGDEGEGEGDICALLCCWFGMGILGLGWVLKFMKNGVSLMNRLLELNTKFLIRLAKVQIWRFNH